MNNYKLVIVDSTKIDVCENLIKQKNWQWSFMGGDPCLRERIIGQLGSENKYCYAEELQHTCIEQKPLFLDWIAEIGKQQDKTFWWATNLAYKNPYNSDLFLNYCYLILIQKWIEQKVKKRVIIIENPWLVKACSCNFNSDAINITTDVKYFVKKWIKHRAVSYARLFFFLLRSLRMWIVNKAYVLKYNKQITTILKSKIDVLTCTWIENRSFISEDDKFSDPYLGTLNDYYKKMGLNVATITVPFFPIKLLKKVYKCGEIIPSIYFTKLSDIFRSFFKATRLEWNKKYSDCNDLDLTSIFEYERIAEKGMVCYGFLYYRTFLNLFRINTIPLFALFYPFENQRWDKMMVLAKKAAKTNWKMVGCHNIGVPSFYLNFFLGDGENVLCPQPDIIASNGSYWEKVLRNAGFSCEIKNGGSLRFGAEIEKRNVNTKSLQSNRNDHVLVLLSTSLSYSLDLMFYLLRTSGNEKTYYVKPHPDTPAEIIQKHTGLLPENFKFVGGTMDEWMAKVGWAVHVGTNAAIECMMNGINVFKYLPERIDLDPLLGLGFEQSTITDKDTLDFDNKKIGKVPSSQLIAEPFNEELWNTILEQECS